METKIIITIEHDNEDLSMDILAQIGLLLLDNEKKMQGFTIEHMIKEK